VLLAIYIKVNKSPWPILDSVYKRALTRSRPTFYVNYLTFQGVLLFY
jgi:hypothetical protein